MAKAVTDFAPQSYYHDTKRVGRRTWSAIRDWANNKKIGRHYVDPDKVELLAALKTKMDQERKDKKSTSGKK